REVELPEPVEVASVPVPQVPLLVREVAVREPQPQLREREVVVVTAPAIQAPRPREVDLPAPRAREPELRPREVVVVDVPALPAPAVRPLDVPAPPVRSEEHTSELQSRENLVCRLLLEKKMDTQVGPDIPAIR